jgi:Holliday junction resolvasome RuvABC endonuclease subunit
MGIDPSHQTNGWAVMSCDENNLLKVMKYGEVGVADCWINPSVSEESARYMQYGMMADALLEIAKRNEVEKVVIEAAWTSIISKPMIFTIEARAVICSAFQISSYVRDITTYSTMKVKKYMVGTRKVSKAQMKKAVKDMYKIKEKISDHEADAIALITSYILSK